MGRGAATVYRDRRVLFPIVGTFFGGSAIGILSPQFVLALRDGGLDITVNGRPEFWENPWGALFILAFASPFLAVGVFGWLYWLNNQIILDDQGIRSINLFGKQDFIAAWPLLSRLYEARSGNTAAVRVSVGDNDLNISTTHPHCGEIVRRVRDMTQSPAERKARKQRVPVSFEDRPDRTFKYPFPFFTVFALAPFLLMAFFVVRAGILDDGSEIGYWFVGLLLLLPLAIILTTAVSAAKGHVFVGAHRFRIIDGMGRVALDALWHEIEGVYYEGDSRTSGRGVNPLGYYRLYRIETESQKAKIRSSLRGFGVLMNELRSRLPADVFYVDE